jgi:hypothetical protein
VTLLEVLLAGSLLAVVLGVSYSLLLSGGKQQDFVQRHADLADQTRRVVRRLSKDLRSATYIIRVRRDGTRLEELALRLPDPEDETSFLDVLYEYDGSTRRLIRDGEPLLADEVRDVQLFAFDELGRLLLDPDVPELVAFFRLRFELGDEDAPPARRRQLDLTLTPRVPASEAKADRILMERALDRFGAPGGAGLDVPDLGGTGSTSTGRPGGADLTGDP